MNDDDIRKGSLVIVIDRDNTPPRICWGLVHNRLPSGNCDIQIGGSPKQKSIISGDKLILICQTDGKFATPDEAVEHNRNNILLQVALVAFTSREFAELKRLKTMTERKLKGRLKRGLARLFHRV